MAAKSFKPHFPRLTCLVGFSTPAPDDEESKGVQYPNVHANRRWFIFGPNPHCQECIQEENKDLSFIVGVHNIIYSQFGLILEQHFAKNSNDWDGSVINNVHSSNEIIITP